MFQLKSVFLFIAITITTYKYSNGDTNATFVDIRDAPECPKTPTLNNLADYTNLWRNVRMCFREAESKAIMDSDGRLYLTYRSPIREAEDASNFKFIFFLILIIFRFNSARIRCTVSVYARIHIKWSLD